jgi:hypothetical protein
MTTTDITKHLRDRADWIDVNSPLITGHIERNAAAEIERLRGIIIAARERLEKIIQSDEPDFESGVVLVSHEHFSQLGDTFVELRDGLHE